MPTMTAAERRELERLEYNAFLDECPTRQLVATLGDKWVTLVLCALRDGPKRYTEVARQIAGVSQKMLTQTLRTLERDGIVTRHVTPSVPGPRRLRADAAGPEPAGGRRADQGVGRGEHGRRARRARRL